MNYCPPDIEPKLKEQLLKITSKSADETETGTVIQCLIVTPSSRLSVVSKGCSQRFAACRSGAFRSTALSTKHKC
jgi:hypothetical protein